ncbi:hypothetical protein [Shimwellia blattae]|uniref:Phage protein n=1 Tax=Shimwellia blattae (strain ATCC 29907 / DSM 4481 / JCM 1650 / NBRC 105725 / CDC 9005-74) TaxID=630626 RepID=I2B9G6_SHIBC|nr:hypothetical protein [Shimwellia blattae]AFJ47170.1 hypothetical protein EBL_c20790 [Shimwellia blattae DSM 4481 = NBRC 105725]
MKRSWFYHFNCTTEQADELVARYSSRGVKTERSLNTDFLSWTVAAWLPERIRDQGCTRSGRRSQ